MRPDGWKTSGQSPTRATVVEAEARQPEATEGTTPQLILIATGSEVSLAMEARESLQKDGIATRVVSMPCTELFDEQSEDYRNQVLIPSVPARLAIEAGVRQCWDRYVGLEGDVIGLDRFGASAPGDVAMRELGFNMENVLKHAKALLKN